MPLSLGVAKLDYVAIKAKEGIVVDFCRYYLLHKFVYFILRVQN